MEQTGNTRYNVRIIDISDGKVLREYNDLIDLRYVGNYLLMRRDDKHGELVVPKPGFVVEIVTYEAGHDSVCYQ